VYVFNQTKRVRCVFEGKDFEFKNLNKEGKLVRKPNKNYVKGTINRWDCSKTVDYGFAPSKALPLITYFWETGTGNDAWGEYSWWGKFWTGIARERQDGTTAHVHFFPGFIDVDKWETELLARGASKQPFAKPVGLQQN